jgi:hypothetical protein
MTPLKPYYQHAGITIYHGDLFHAIVVEALDARIERLSLGSDFGIVCHTPDADPNCSPLAGGQVLRFAQRDENVGLFRLDAEIGAQCSDGGNGLEVCCCPTIEGPPVRRSGAIALAELNVAAEERLEHIRHNRRELGKPTRLAVGSRTAHRSPQHREVPIGIHRTRKISQIGFHVSRISHGIREVHCEAVL